MSVVPISELRGSLYTPAAYRPRWHFMPQWAGRFARRTLHLMVQAMAEYRFRRAARELSRLDDRMLKDIGLSRSEIERVVRHGRPCDLEPLRQAFDLNPHFGN